MQSVILPQVYFGNTAYYRYINEAQTVFISDREFYRKQSYRNRTRILAANGILDLTVPVKSTKGIPTPINKIEISYAENWPLNHWRSIQSAYKAAPFFEEFEEDIKKIIFSETMFLSDLNKLIINKIAELMDFEKAIRYVSEHKTPENIFDLCADFKPGKEPDYHSQLSPYLQVFNYKFGFTPNLSILDWLFNEGPGVMP